METARSGHGTVALADGFLVAFGGEERDGGTPIEGVEVFDPVANSWAALADMTTPRHGLAAADGQRVFAIEGGPEPGLSLSNANEYLDVP